jgi:hypothetical protein
MQKEGKLKENQEFKNGQYVIKVNSKQKHHPSKVVN